MSRVTTKTGLANLTASMLKVDAVTTIEPPVRGSKFAKLADRWYDETRREVLAEHTWNFAMKRVNLAADATAPAFGYTTRYLLPADYIRVAFIRDEQFPETDYKIEQGYILTNSTGSLPLGYIFDQEDITQYTAKFIQCFARKLAVHLCYEMIGNQAAVERLQAAYISELSTTQTLDGQESPPTKRIRRSRWKAAKEARGLIGDSYSGRVVT